MFKKAVIFCAILLPAILLGFSGLANAAQPAGWINPTPPPLTQTAQMIYWCSNYYLNCPAATVAVTPIPYPGIVVDNSCQVTYPGFYTCTEDDIFTGYDAVPDGEADPEPTAVPMLIQRPGRNR